MGGSLSVARAVASRLLPGLPTGKESIPGGAEREVIRNLCAPADSTIRQVMTSDPFSSGPIASTLAWVVSVPALIGTFAAVANMLFGPRESGVPRWLLFWMALCVLIISPFRYIVLQVLLTGAYLVQSPTAFLSGIWLTALAPIVIGLSYAIGIGAPLFAVTLIGTPKASTSTLSPVRLAAVAVATPVLLMVGRIAFFFALFWLGWPFHMLRGRDLIAATNGPVLAYYSAVISPMEALPVGHFYRDVSDSDRAMLRNHVAAIYLSNDDEIGYIRAAYPTLYLDATTRK